jgi:putative transposase
MADEQNNEPGNSTTEAGNEGTAPVQRKRRSPGSRAAPAGAGSRKVTSPSPTAKSRRYSEGEKAEKLRQIEAQLAEGATLKAAANSAGISGQTYYQWKRSAAAHAQPEIKPVSKLETLADLVELEAENQRLRKLLAEKLRAENAELRKRLGVPSVS